MDRFRYIYGPVPSRRLGRSLGVDLVPLKTCPYDCVYCQLGRTTNKTIERRTYAPIEKILDEVKQKLEVGTNIDHITLAGSGEPTLNSDIGNLICKIKSLTNIPLAVLTNGSLLWMKEVQEALLASDLVLPSLDAGDERLFRYVNHPHKHISFERMVAGIAEFTRRFRGEVWLEVFLLAGVTGLPVEVEKLSAIANRIAPARIQLNTVSRPPTHDFAIAVPTEQMFDQALYFSQPVDILCDNSESDSDAVALSGASDGDILALLRRRPCTSSQVAHGLGIHVTEALKRLNTLLSSGKIRIVHNGKSYFYKAT